MSKKKPTLEEMLKNWQADMPVPEGLAERIVMNAGRPKIWRRFALAFRRPVAVGLGALVLFSGGVSYAAEGALPGDSLYKVKVNVNEEVVGFFHPNKANWEVSRMERRLNELDKLEEFEDMIELFEDELEGRWERHSGDALRFIEHLEEEGDSERAEKARGRYEKMEKRFGERRGDYEGRGDMPPPPRPKRRGH